MRLLPLLLFTITSLFALDATEIIRKLEDNFRGNDVSMKMEMVVRTKRHARTVRIESWAEGKTKSFMRILYPPRDRGITFLKIDNQLWQYVPKIERTIKIPPSMMLQSWMGSDFTNDDMVKESSIGDDYTARLLATDGDLATIELIPHEDAAVVWGKIVTVVDTVQFVPLRETYYDDFGEKVRTMHYSDVQTFGAHHIPTIMRLEPHDPGKAGNETVVTLRDVVYDEGIDSGYFTKKALKRFAR